MWPALMCSARETMDALNPSACAGVRMGRSNHTPTMATANQAIPGRRLLVHCHESTILCACGDESARKVKSALEQPPEYRSVETQSLPTFDFAETHSAECVPPLARRPIRIAQWYAVPDIPHPVHQSKSLVTQPGAREVILDDHGVGGHPTCFADQQGRIDGMVKDIHEHDHILRAIREWEHASVELLNGNRGVGPRTDLHAGGYDVRAARHDGTRQGAVAAPNIQQGGQAGRDHLGDVVRKRLD